MPSPRREESALLPGVEPPALTSLAKNTLMGGKRRLREITDIKVDLVSIGALRGEIGERIL